MVALEKEPTEKGDDDDGDGGGDGNTMMVMVMVITMVIVVGAVISIPKEPVIMKCLGVRIVSDPGGGCFNSAGVSMSNCWSRSLFIARSPFIAWYCVVLDSIG